MLYLQTNDMTVYTSINEEDEDCTTRANQGESVLEGQPNVHRKYEKVHVFAKLNRIVTSPHKDCR